MLKYVLVFIILLNFLHADKLSSFLKAYKNEDAKKACEIGRQLYRLNIRDENILIAISQVCAQDDFIDFIGVVQQRFGKSVHSREAAVYISTIVLQKHLISQFLYEDIDISVYDLPKTPHILSTIFEAIKNKEYTKDKNAHIYIKKSEQLIDIYIQEKIYVDIYENKKLIKKHRFRS